MRLQVLEASDTKAWNTALEGVSWTHNDIYFAAQWYRHWERAGYGDGRALLVEVDDVRFFYPFLLRRIDGYDVPDAMYDVETAYGLGGVLVGGDVQKVDDGLIADLNSGIDEWMVEHRVVCEFLRLTPELNHSRVRRLEYHHVRWDLFLDLEDRSVDDLWMSLGGTARTDVRRARRNGLELVIDHELARIREFASVYEDAARRIGMAPFYHFDYAYFDAFAEDLQNRSMLLLACREGEILAGSLWLLGGETIHYYLAATRSDSVKLGCADLLIWGAEEFVAEQPGLSRLHLGGGLGVERDSLFRFKSKYGNREERVFVATGVRDRRRYEQVVNQWRKRFPDLVGEHGHKLLCYRVQKP